MSLSDLEDILKARIRRLGHLAPSQLGLLPTGVEVILAKKWDAAMCYHWAPYLGYSVEFTLVPL